MADYETQLDQLEAMVALSMQNAADLVRVSKVSMSSNSSSETYRNLMMTNLEYFRTFYPMLKELKGRS